MNKTFQVSIFMLLVLSLLLVLNRNITLSAVDDPEYSCGDGICTIPFEDEIICPEDCLRKGIDPFPYFIGAIILLFIGLFYFNLYKGKADLRRLTKGKNPFKSDNDYKKVYNYIKSSLNIGVDRKEIIKNLYKKNWTKKQVVYAFEDVKWNQRKVLLETAPKATPDLRPAEEYIKKCRAVNIPDNKIKKSLIDNGWKRSHVRKAFRNMANS